MIPVCQCNFACDECPIVEDLDFRLAIAGEDPEWGELQYDHCACAKVGDEGDVWEDPKAERPAGRRKTGRAYRRRMECQKFERCKHIAEEERGWFAYRVCDDGSHIKRRKRSKTWKFWKKHYNGVVRRYNKDYIPRGNWHRKLSGYYWW